MLFFQYGENFVSVNEKKGGVGSGVTWYLNGHHCRLDSSCGSLLHVILPSSCPLHLFAATK